MYRIKNSLIIYEIIYLIFSFIATAGGAEKPDSLLKKAEKSIYPEDVTYIGEMIIKRPKKEIHKKIKVYLKGYEKSLIEFLDPPQERGTRILMIGNNMWMFLPSIEKVIRLSSKMNVTGGDFIYDDILRVKYTVDYEAVSISNEGEYNVLSIKAKTNLVSYEEIKIWIDSSNNLPVKQNFYVSDGTLLKSLAYSELKSFAGKLVPTQLIMQLTNSEDYKTFIKIIDYDTKEISERVFTQEYLKKGL